MHNTRKNDNYDIKKNKNNSFIQIYTNNEIIKDKKIRDELQLTKF